MSASSWAICPQCTRQAEQRRAEAEKKAAEVYGKVPLQEYIEVSRGLAGPTPKQTYELHETYEVGIQGDELVVDYSASCQVCGFRFNFQRSFPVEIKK